MGAARVYGVRSWYLPCFGWDWGCYEYEGTEAAKMKHSVKLAGYHHDPNAWT
jgi:hypothetical protein